MTLLRFLQLRLSLHDAIVTSSHLAGFGICMTRGFQACCQGCPLAVFWSVRPTANGTTGVWCGQEYSAAKAHRSIMHPSCVPNLLEVSQRLLYQRQALLGISGCCSQPAVMVVLRMQKHRM